jgi:hypothetical protein
VKNAARLGIVVLLVAATTPSPAQQRTEVETIKQQLIGSYKLISYDSYDVNGTATRLPYTAGQISFDPAGRMSVQLMGNDRPAIANGQRASEADRAAAYASYQAYFGHYTIQPDKGTVTYHVEGALVPSMVGSELVRYYEFSSDRRTLYLSVPNGDRVVGKLRWERY